MLHGAEIVGPEELREMPYPIVVASLLHQSEIVRQIRAMNLENRVIVLRDHPEEPYVFHG
jgi:hypothetical protein